MSSSPKTALISCVQGLSVAEERKLLAEIRTLGVNNIDRNTWLSNGMLAQEFAMIYVIGMRRKRQINMQKSKAKRKAKEQQKKT